MVYKEGEAVSNMFVFVIPTNHGPRVIHVNIVQGLMETPPNKKNKK